MSDRFRICDEAIDPAAVLEAVRDPACGAIATFLGTVRATNDGKDVVRLEYEVHDTMALKQLERLARALHDAYAISSIAVHHRRGVVEVGGVSVAIAVAAPHRAPALQACAEAIEYLKRDVPIWKREVYPDGHKWMEGS